MSLTFLAYLFASSHFVVERDLVLVSIFLPVAGGACVIEVLGDPMRPAIGNGVAVGVIPLGDANLVGFLGVVVVGGALGAGAGVGVASLAEAFGHNCFHIGTGKRVGCLRWFGIFSGWGGGCLGIA